VNDTAETIPAHMRASPGADGVAVGGLASGGVRDSAAVHADILLLPRELSSLRWPSDVDGQPRLRKAERGQRTAG
jgi:hypothetical protein